MFLVPGGEYLMVHWGDTLLQCWHVPSGECVWHYDFKKAEENHFLSIDAFDVEVQPRVLDSEPLEFHILIVGSGLSNGVRTR